MQWRLNRLILNWGGEGVTDEHDDVIQGKGAYVGDLQTVGTGCRWGKVWWDGGNRRKMGESLKLVASLCYQSGVETVEVSCMSCTVDNGKCCVLVVALLAKEAMNPKYRRLC